LKDIHPRVALSTRRRVVETSIEEDTERKAAIKQRGSTMRESMQQAIKRWWTITVLKPSLMRQGKREKVAMAARKGMAVVAAGAVEDTIEIIKKAAHRKDTMSSNQLMAKINSTALAEVVTRNLTTTITQQEPKESSKLMPEAAARREVVIANIIERKLLEVTQAVELITSKTSSTRDSTMKTAMQAVAATTNQRVTIKRRRADPTTKRAPRVAKARSMMNPSNTRKIPKREVQVELQKTDLREKRSRRLPVSWQLVPAMQNSRVLDQPQALLLQRRAVIPERKGTSLKTCSHSSSEKYIFYNICITQFPEGSSLSVFVTK
jgi:hypothetical protein